MHFKAYDILKQFEEDLFQKRHEELKKEVQQIILKKHKDKFIPKETWKE